MVTAYLSSRKLFIGFIGALIVEVLILLSLLHPGNTTLVTSSPTQPVPVIEQYHPQDQSDCGFTSLPCLTGNVPLAPEVPGGG